MHCIVYICTLYMHSVYIHCPAKSYKSFLLSTRYGSSFLCVGNCTPHTAIIVLELLLCITLSMDCEVLHCFAIIFFTTLQEKDFVFSAMQLAPEWRNVYATFTFMYIVYVCWSFLCLSWPNCEKLCWISLGGEWGESNSMWPCQCRE